MALLQASNDGDPMRGPHLYLRGQLIRPGKHDHPDSTLKKKSHRIAYNFIREGAARCEWRTSYVNTHDNEADLLTKIFPSSEKRKCFVQNLLHHIFQINKFTVYVTCCVD